jgi:hypothetical protein
MVGAGFADTEGLKELGDLDLGAFSPGRFWADLFDSIGFSVCSVGDGACLALQPTVNPVPTMANPPTISAKPRLNLDICILFSLDPPMNCLFVGVSD